MQQLLKGLFGDLELKVIALVIGILLWFLASIERSHQIEIKIPTQISAPDSGYVLTSLIPDTVRVFFTAKGSRLIPIKIQPPRLTINLRGKKSGFHYFTLERNNLLPESNQDVKVEFIPRKIKVRLVRESKRYVDLWVPIIGNPGDNYAISEIERPQKVLLIGAKDLLVGINQVYTETLSIEAAHGKIDTALTVLPPSRLISPKPSRVPIIVNIEECAETTFSYLPVIIDRKKTQFVTVSPERATIQIKGPKTKIRGLDQSKIEIKISIRKLTSGEFQLPAQITLPSGLDLIRSDPKTFKVTIR